MKTIFANKDCQYRICDEYMGRFPVIFISLKGAEGATFREAALSLAEVVRDEIRRHNFLLEADLLVEMENPDAGLVIELKTADKVTELDGACKRAIKQIHDRRYDEYLRNEGRNDIWAYGIAFYKKRCRAVAHKLTE